MFLCFVSRRILCGVSFLSGLATALSLLVVDLVVPGITIDTLTAAAIAAITVGLVNAFVKPLLQAFTVPIQRR